MSTDSSPMLNVPATIQAAVDSDAWRAWIDHQKSAHDGDTCPKDGSRLTWDNYHRTYTCDSCGWSEAPPKQ